MQDSVQELKHTNFQNGRRLDFLAEKKKINEILSTEYKNFWKDSKTLQVKVGAGRGQREK